MRETQTGFCMAGLSDSEKIERLTAAVNAAALVLESPMNRFGKLEVPGEVSGIVRALAVAYRVTPSKTTEEQTAKVLRAVVRDIEE